MAEVRLDAELGSDIDEVWKLIRDFEGFATAMGLPVEMEGEGIGQTRSISMGGAPTVERLEACDDDARRLVYSIVASPLPITDYLSTMQLTALGEGRTRLDWSSTFEATPGASEDEAVAIIRRIYQGGIAGLQQHFGA